MTTKDQGLSLLDIGSLAEQVPVGDSTITVYGVSAKGALSIFQRFPEVGSWFKGGKREGMDGLMTEAPEAIAAIIAAGCGMPGNEDAEQNAGNLPLETQLDILEAIGRLTFSKGFGPFVQRIVALSKAVESLSYGKASDMTSPQASKPASRPDTTAFPSGT